MNLPNKLTILRICMVPVFLLFALPLPDALVRVGGAIGAGGLLASFNSFFSGGGSGSWICGAIFVAAFATDMLDGYIARRYDMVTDFGKFLDPIADKLLATAALAVLVERGELSAWVLAIIVSREFIVTGARLLAASEGVVLAAGRLGKLKTVAQTIAIALMLFHNFGVRALDAVRADAVFMAAAVILTIVSGVAYIAQNRRLFNG
jgi:CDP-diacylglycerol--glycerol-3-phosphate 3-phosphatidyltransferase